MSGASARMRHLSIVLCFISEPPAVISEFDGRHSFDNGVIFSLDDRFLFLRGGHDLSLVFSHDGFIHPYLASEFAGVDKRERFEEAAQIVYVLDGVAGLKPSRQFPVFFFVVFSLFFKHGNKIVFRFLLRETESVSSVYVFRVDGYSPVVRLCFRFFRWGM